ncbi:MAG: hypothetical protein RL268_18 [Pseudomonadota bacterium]|jgi:hypothetical protein
MSEIEGFWKLLSWSQEYDDGRIVYPMGEALIGQLIYGANQRFSVFISRAERERFCTGGQWTAAADEKAKAYDSVLAYIGRYEFDGLRMKHKVQASLFPDWVGHTQMRDVELSGDILTLRGRMEENSPQARTAKLVWRRARSED